MWRLIATRFELIMRVLENRIAVVNVAHAFLQQASFAFAQH